MTVGVLPDEIIMIDYSKYNNLKGNNPTPPQKIIEQNYPREKSVHYGTTWAENCQADNATNENMYYSQRKNWNEYASNRWCSRIGCVVFKTVIVLAVLSVPAVLGFMYKDSILALFDKGPRLETTTYILEAPKWIYRDDKTLHHVVILFRHGEISPPKDTFPKDTNKNYVWENGYDALTKKGMRRMYKLGQWIRNRYVFLNNGQYNKSNTVVESLADDYCIMSTQALLAGLYPPTAKESLFDNFLWRPIAIKSIPKELDQVLGATAECKGLEKRKKELTKEFVHSAPVQTIFKENYVGTLSNITGINNIKITDVDTLKKLYNIYESQKAEGLKVKQDFQNLKSWIPRYLQYPTNDLKFQKLKSGQLLKQIMVHLNNSRENIVLYGVNEYVLGHLLGSLSLFKRDDSRYLINPSYGSSLIFELHRDSKNSAPIVKLYYLKKSLKEKLIPLPLTSYCETKCNLNTLWSNNLDIMYRNWDDECKE